MAYSPVSFSANEKLTSTKMNQMAANDASFHDGTGIDDGAINSDKLDFSSFAGNTTQIRIGDETKSVGSTYTDFGSTYTVPKSGLYSIYLYINGGASGSTKMRSIGRVKADNTVVTSLGVYSVENYNGTNFAEGHLTRLFWFDEGVVLKLQGANENWTGNLFAVAVVQPVY